MTAEHLEPLDPRMARHLRVEFGAHGARSVEFLKTAYDLLNLGPSTRPRLAQNICFSLREALVAIVSSFPVAPEYSWREASRKVADARRRFELVKDLPGEDGPRALSDLLKAIDDLERVHAQERIHQQRLIRIMVERTGAAPISHSIDPVEEYQGLLDALNKALHGDSDLDRARELWHRSLAILRRLFMPPDLREPGLEDLATIESPSAADVDRLRDLVASPNHLRYFLSRIMTFRWLEVLADTGVLDPPVGRAPWPVFAAVNGLAADHGPALATWLDRMYDRCGSDAEQAWYIAKAALEVTPDGADVVLRALRDHPSHWAIALLGVLAVDRLESSSPVVEEFADVLLNESSWPAHDDAERVIRALVEGVNPANAAGRLELLCWKLKSAATAAQGAARWFAFDRAGSVADWSDVDREDRFTVLLRGLVELIREARRWLSTDELLEPLRELPAEVGGRLRIWILSEATDVDVGRLIDELAADMARREPTGDDLPIIDRVIGEAPESEWAQKWAQALGDPPAVPEAAQALAAQAVPEAWLRAYQWVTVLPASAIGGWEQPARVIAATYGPMGREALSQPHRVEVGWGRSPISLEELQALPVAEAADKIASWRPDGSQWLASARELARTLEAAVKADPDAWVGSPLDIVTRLRHPTYIHHYLRGVADAIRDGACPPVAEVLDVIGLVRANPWSVETLGRDDFDYDLDWRGAEQASVDLLKAMADKHLGFAGRDDEAWGFLLRQARDRTARSSVAGDGLDALDRAMNRPCTRALEAVLSFMAHEFRAAGTVRPAAFELLEEALRIPGDDGGEHRAVIVTRLGFLRHIAPGWVDAAADLMFGDDAPTGLAQVSVDLALKWGRPNRWLLERYGPLVRDAVARGAKNAIDHLMVGMLWGVPGYGVGETVRFLRQPPALLSDAGMTLGRLLRDDADEAHLVTAVVFWDTAIEAGRTEALAGFGWFAEIGRLDDDTWAERTFRTLRATHGRIEWAHGVAERAGSLAPSPTTLAIMNELVRGASDEWEKRDIIERAVQVVRAADQLAGTPEYEQLHTALTERGAL